MSTDKKKNFKEKKTKSRILIVEDERIIQRVIHKSLESFGYDVVGKAAAGKEAIQLAAESNPDLILMDIHLEDDIDGIEAANKIHEKQDIPIIYLTAFADEPTIQRAKITTPFGYILKPFEQRDLRTNIEMALYKNQIEQKLKEREMHFRTISEEAITGICVLLRGKIQYVNQRFAEMFEYSQKEIMKWDAIEFLNSFHPDHFSIFIKNILKKRLSESDENIGFKLKIRQKSGRNIWIEMFSKKIEYKGKNADLLIVTEIDEPEDIKFNAISDKKNHYQILMGEYEALSKIENKLGNEIPRFSMDEQFSFGYISDEEHIIQLNLYDKGIENIHETFKNLIFLQSLNLGNNKIETLTDSFDELKNLEHLALNGNNLKDFPDVLCNIEMLKKIVLPGNQIKRISPLIEKLINLEDLNLDNNQIQEISEDIQNIPSLIKLSIENNKLTSLPQNIGNYSSLEFLNLGENQLKELPDSIGNLQKIKKLDLRQNQLISLPTTLQQLSNLEYLNLMGNPIRNLPEFLGDMPALEVIYVNENIFGNLPDKIKKISKSCDVLKNIKELGN